QRFYLGRKIVLTFGVVHFALTEDSGASQPLRCNQPCLLCIELTAAGQESALVGKSPRCIMASAGYTADVSKKRGLIPCKPHVVSLIFRDEMSAEILDPGFCHELPKSFCVV